MTVTLRRENNLWTLRAPDGLYLSAFLSRDNALAHCVRNGWTVA